MNTLISFELAKLLKEKNINIPSDYSLGVRIYEDGVIKSTCLYNKDTLHAPTIAEVVMWLYEKHGIWITVCVIGADGFGYWLHNKNRKRLNPEDQGGYWYSPTEAYEAAIEYTLKNLI